MARLLIGHIYTLYLKKHFIQWEFISAEDLEVANSQSFKITIVWEVNSDLISVLN